MQVNETGRVLFYDLGIASNEWLAILASWYERW